MGVCVLYFLKFYKKFLCVCDFVHVWWGVWTHMGCVDGHFGGYGPYGGVTQKDPIWGMGTHNPMGGSKIDQNGQKWPKNGQNMVKNRVKPPENGHFLRFLSKSTKIDDFGPFWVHFWILNMREFPIFIENPPKKGLKLMSKMDTPPWRFGNFPKTPLGTPKNSILAKNTKMAKKCFYINAQTSPPRKFFGVKIR